MFVFKKYGQNLIFSMEAGILLIEQKLSMNISIAQ